MLTARMCIDMAAATERTCATLLAYLGNEAFAARCERVHVDTGNVFDDTREIHVDGKPIWRLWWVETSEAEPGVWRMETGWGPHPVLSAMVASITTVEPAS